MAAGATSARRGRRLAIAGGVLVASALVAGLLADRFVLFEGQAGESLAVVYGREVEEQRLRSDAADRWIETVSIEVPQRVALGDQAVLRLEYGVELQRGAQRFDLAELGEGTRVGAALRTGPSLVVVPPPELADGAVVAPLPVRLSWLIEPQSLGTKRLLLDLDLDRPLDADTDRASDDIGDDFVVRRRSLSINGVSRVAPTDEALPFEILAVTRFGLSQQAFTLLRLVASGLGFLLTYPLLVEVAKRWLSRRDSAEGGSPEGGAPSK